MARREIKVERPTADDVHEALTRVPPEGAIVRLPAGSIPIDRPLDLPSATTLAGAGRGQTVLEATAGLATVVTATKGRNVTVRDLTITWPGDAADQAQEDGAALLFRAIYRPEVLAVEVLGPPATAAWFDRCTHLRIDGLRIRNAGRTGLLATACRHLAADDITVDGAGLRRTASGVHLDGAQEARMHVDAARASGSAVLLDATSGPVEEVVMHVNATHSLRGFSAIAAAPHPVHRVTLSGTFADNRRDGILLVNANRVVILDAVVERNAEHGIVLDGRTGSRRCTITGTVIRGCPVPFAELGGSRDNAISSVQPPAPITSTPEKTTASSRLSLPRRARRAAIVRVRRAWHGRGGRP